VAEFRIVRPFQRTDKVQAPDLFPDFDRFRDYRSKRKYVSDRLVELARSGSLFLTHIFNQPPEIVEIAGNVIHGVGIDSENKFVPRIEVPLDLEAARVRIRGINGNLVGWERSQVEGEPLKQTERTKATGDYFRVQSERVETDQGEVELPLMSAWLCLKESGKYVRRAKSADQQQRYWKCEEVPPAQKDPPTPERSPERSRKSFAEANQPR
jgi:hypothetical protein